MYSNIQNYDKNDKRNDLPTRLDLSNNWDKDTISSSIFMSEDGPKEGEFVYFYAVQCDGINHQVKAVEINPKPRPIRATYDLGKSY